MGYGMARNLMACRTRAMGYGMARNLMQSGYEVLA